MSFEFAHSPLQDRSLCIIPALSVAAPFNSLLRVALWKSIEFSFTFSTQVPDLIMEVNSRCRIHGTENVKANPAAR